MRVAVGLVVLVTTAANAEAVESRLDAASSQSASIIMTTYRCEAHAQFDKARAKSAKRALSAVREAYIQLATGIAGVERTLTGIDAARDL